MMFTSFTHYYSLIVILSSSKNGAAAFITSTSSVAIHIRTIGSAATSNSITAPFTLDNNDLRLKHNVGSLHFKDTDSDDMDPALSVDTEEEKGNQKIHTSAKNEQNQNLFNSQNNNSNNYNDFKFKLPPMEVQDTPLLLYDILLLLNLSLSISFWVVHRLSFFYIVPALSEGSLLSILWIISGLYHGAFLYSAVDGHYDVRKEEEMDKGGPKAAAMLGLNTFVTTASLRIIVALAMAILEHRPVGVGFGGSGIGGFGEAFVGSNGEELIPLEIGCGLVLMSSWRMLHSRYVPRF